MLGIESGPPTCWASIPPQAVAPSPTLAFVIDKTIFYFNWVFETAFLCVGLAGLERRDFPASAPGVLGAKVCATYQNFKKIHTMI